MWSFAPAIGTRGYNVINWNTNSTVMYSPGTSIVNDTFSIDRPAHTVAMPPKEGFAHFWHESDSTTQLFVFSCTVGTVVDIWVDFVMNDDNAPIAGTTLVGATLGQLYHLTIDTGLIVEQPLNTL